MKFLPHEIEVFEFILFLYTITDHESPETHYNIKRGAKRERCELRAYQFLKMWKKEISWNIKTKCVAEIILTVMSSRMEDYTSH